MDAKSVHAPLRCTEQGAISPARHQTRSPPNPRGRKAPPPQSHTLPPEGGCQAAHRAARRAGAANGRQSVHAPLRCTEQGDAKPCLAPNPDKKTGEAKLPPPRPQKSPPKHRNASLAHSCCAHRPRPPRYRSAPALGGAGMKSRGARCAPADGSPPTLKLAAASRRTAGSPPPHRALAARASATPLPPTSGSPNSRREFAEPQGAQSAPSTYIPSPPREGAKRRTAPRGGRGRQMDAKASMRRCDVRSKVMQSPA